MRLQRKILVRPEDVKPSFKDWKVEGVLNPGGVRLKNGKIFLLARVAEAPIHRGKNSVKCPVIISEKEHAASFKTISKKKVEKEDGNVIFFTDKTCKLRTISHFRKIILDKSGLNVESIEQSPTFVGCPHESEYGVEDARITKIKNNFFMTFVTVSERNGVSTSLAQSNDLKKWKRMGTIFQEQNKDVVLFPEKINGLYAALNRPESSFVFSKPSIWISYSTDLVFWGKEKVLLRTRDNSWESERNGAGPPPIKTKKGWLIIYHGIKKEKGKHIYSVGAALLDLKNPEKILARTPKNNPLLVPSISVEKKGFMDNVVFPTTAIPCLDNPKELLIYSGAADRMITVMKLSLKEIFANMEKC
ncbi:MAG: glycosidase [Nanoarchaeota archaeon]|nr:glycosidase [Nanoarchaeota archaeon]MBU1103485.1 glycosidase [Nanoarchaeota archaeon]